MSANKHMTEIHLYNTKGHNKFYDMYNNNDGTFTAYWGKRHTFGQSMDYPMEKWEAKYFEKLDKGYEEDNHTHGMIDYEKHLEDRDKRGY